MVELLTLFPMEVTLNIRDRNRSFSGPAELVEASIFYEDSLPDMSLLQDLQAKRAIIPTAEVICEFSIKQFHIPLYGDGETVHIKRKYTLYDARIETISYCEHGVSITIQAKNCEVSRADMNMEKPLIFSSNSTILFNNVENTVTISDLQIGGLHTGQGDHAKIAS